MLHYSLAVHSCAMLLSFTTLRTAQNLKRPHQKLTIKFTFCFTLFPHKAISLNSPPKRPLLPLLKTRAPATPNVLFSFLSSFFFGFPINGWVASASFNCFMLCFILQQFLRLMDGFCESSRSFLRWSWYAKLFLVFLVAVCGADLPFLAYKLVGVAAGPALIDNNESCLSHCGSVAIPYPFGTAPGCGLPEFRLSCISNNSTTGASTASMNYSFPVDPVLLLSTPSGDFQITAISNSTLSINTTTVKALACSSGALAHAEFALAPPPSPYVLTAQNVFFGAGCNATVKVTFDGAANTEQTCKTGCNNPGGYPYPYCDYCCTIPVPQGTRTIDFYGGVLGNHNESSSSTSCGFATFLSKNSYTPPLVAADDVAIGHLPSSQILGSGHWVTALEWAIPGPNCPEAIKLTNYSCDASASCRNASAGLIGYTCVCTEGYSGDGYKNGSGCTEQEYCKQVPSVCAANATCTASNTTTGYNCACPRGFHGNPYNLSRIGCLDINECNFANSCAQLARCINMPGSYDCSCHSGYFGDGFANGTGCQLTTENSSDNHNVPLIAGLSTAAALIGLGGTLLTVFCFKRESKMRNRFARRNIEALGSMKDVFISLSDGESTVTLFSFKELEKATKGFADDQKVGTGGFGTVYKGKLETGLTIAVKKTNHVGISGLQQFLNEVRVLSQVNHRNLVKLHGCCVETEIPMLVYEYLPNGNLSEHLRGEKPGIHLNWASRMQIAIETAEAITYLHSSANPPIYHRDVKSANILLDNKLSVKVSDFGISRLIQSDATHVSTAVQGTPGYLDPEYFHSYHLTEKSDVYSFGVILLELVTSKYPLDFNRDQKEVNLTAMCIPQIKKGNVEAIVDPQLLNAMDCAETLHEIECVANLATHCVSACRDDRPSMKQVTEELHHIKGTTSQWRADGPNENEFGPEMLEKLAYFRQFLNSTQSFSKPPSPTDAAANSPSVCIEEQKNSR